MKYLILVISLFVLNIHLSAQVSCDPREYYGDFLRIQKERHNNQDFFSKFVVETSKENCFSDFANRNTLYLNYLQINVANKNQQLLLIPDSITLQSEYIRSLKEDSLFNSAMDEIAAKVIEKRLPKDSVSLDQLLNIAVKFFSIMRLTPAGDYVGKVCVGINDIKKTEINRQPHIEAFSFSSIVKHYQSAEFNLNDEFIKALKELNKVHLGIDNSEKLLRAQGGMFMLMRTNENLRKMLLYEYELNKEGLPFILVQ